MNRAANRKDYQERLPKITAKLFKIRMCTVLHVIIAEIISYMRMHE